MAPRGPNIAPSIMYLITRESLRNRDEPREVLAIEILEKISKMNVLQPPSEDYVKRLISKARNSPDPLNEPWTMAKTQDYPISPKAISILFQGKTWGIVSITVRHAIWVDRLCELPMSPVVILKYAGIYAINEIVKFVEPFEIDEWITATLMDPEKAQQSFEDFDKSVDTETEETIMDILKEDEKRKQSERSRKEAR